MGGFRRIAASDSLCDVTMKIPPDGLPIGRLTSGTSSRVNTSPRTCASDSPALRSAARAIALLFVFNGVLLGGWASMVPLLARDYQLNGLWLGALMLLLALGAVAGFRFGGPQVDKRGAREVAIWSYLPYGLALVAVAQQWTLSLLALAIFALGFFHAVMDVAMNSMAARYEQCRQRSCMPGFHALFSVGAGLGAASGSLTQQLGGSLSIQACGLMLLFGPGLLWIMHSQTPPSAAELAASAQPADSGSQSVDQEISGSGATFSSGAAPGFAVLALVAAGCAMIEGVMADWLALFLIVQQGAPDAQAPLGFAAFSLAMVAGRLAAPRFVDRYGSVRVLQWSLLIGVTGLVWLLLSPYWLASLPAWLLIGLGYASIIPLCFSLAANASDDDNAGMAASETETPADQHKHAAPEAQEGRRLARMGVFAYGGMLTGPVLIGWLYYASGMLTAFVGLLLVAMVMLLALRRAVRGTAEVAT